MKRTPVFLLLTLVLSVAAGAQTAGRRTAAAKSEKQAVLRAERTYVERLLRGDVAALDKLFSDDYVATKNHGEVWDKATHLAFIRSGAHKFLSLDFQDANVRIYGNTAVVTGRLDYQARDDGGEFTGQSRYTHVYVKRNGRWYMTTNHFNRFGPQVHVSAQGTPAEPANPTDGVTNKYCPVVMSMKNDGARVSANPAFRTEYKGQYVYFASEKCIKEFDADPEKAIAQMDPDDRAAITTNEFCPYTGLKVSAQRSEADGKIVYFCCAHCKWEFDSIQKNRRASGK